MIERGCYLDAVDKDGITPLQWAIHQNVIDVAMLLIEKGAHIDCADGSGKTALDDLGEQADGIAKKLIFAILFKHPDRDHLDLIKNQAQSQIWEACRLEIGALREENEYFKRMLDGKNENALACIAQNSELTQQGEALKRKCPDLAFIIEDRLEKSTGQIACVKIRNHALFTCGNGCSSAAI